MFILPNPPCENGGECSEAEGMNGTCNCSAVDYDGDICDQWINDCLGSMCVHGVCVDGIRTYSCDCYSGYTGMYCVSTILETFSHIFSPVLSTKNSATLG